MAYYGSSGVIQQGAGALGQVPWAGAYAEGILGGRPNELMPGELQAYREGVFSSLGTEGMLTQLSEQKRLIVYGVGVLAVGAIAASIVLRKKRRR